MLRASTRPDYFNMSEFLFKLNMHSLDSLDILHCPPPVLEGLLPLLIAYVRHMSKQLNTRPNAYI